MMKPSYYNIINAKNNVNDLQSFAICSYSYHFS